MNFFQSPKDSTLVCCAVLQLVGIAIFLKGFFPIKASIPGSAEVTDSCFTLNKDCCSLDQELAGDGCFVPPIFDKVVFIVVDALRADFVLPAVHKDARRVPTQDFPQMSFVRELIDKNETISFLASARPPTVTLPRIKVTYYKFAKLCFAL